MGYIMDLRKIVGSRPLIMAGACVIIVNPDNELLLQLRQDNHCWGLAGGSLEIAETLEQVAKRELFEETGLVAGRLTLFNVYSGPDFYYQYPHGDEVYNVVAAYICRDYSGDLIKDENEVKELKFFPMADIPPNISTPDLPIITDFIHKYVSN
ncbi:NUDIX hydrolase [Rossellomorea aquimaris]|uniref:NUDIX hydrolase n=1 Tax=Rossellomorea aquimaris TaxID=189382 RepID=UPI001CFDC24C|nr:NUDIX hydrolase [Rossellomorea aquimaris]